ncbi:MAG: hypothetical protein HZC42_12065 [Candidatus Eisenbacteria bacterium]|nr:hypothetical protein [Candidatus Eisenbacteria bacterium]
MGRDSSRGGPAARTRNAGMLTAALLALAAPAARAVETQWWIADTPADYAKSESRGVVVGADGTLELGPRAAVAPAESLSVVWAVVALADGSVALAGDHGRIARWTEAGGVRPWVRLAAGQVLALAADGDGLLAGTGPDGAIYRISPRGDTALFARTGERYVWALASAGGGAWYAATGTRGRLYRVTRGAARLLIDTDESNLVSLVPDGRGGAYFGGDSRGRVMHARADGSVRTLYDAAEDEVRALAVGADGALYAAALSASAVSGDEKDAEGPAPAQSAVGGGRSTVYRIVPDSSVVPWWVAPQPFVFALLAAPREQGGGMLAATGNRAGVHRIERANGAAQWLAPPQGQVTALAADAAGRLYAATSNPAALWRLGPGRADQGDLLSPVLDARRTARFGRLLWRGDAGGGRVTLAARSGNTDPPDTTWTGWSGGAAGEEGLPVAAPPARYLQWKVTLAGGRPRIESVEAAWREQNLPPRVEDVVVAPQGAAFREGELQPRMEPVTQTLPGGQKVEYSLPPGGGPRQLRGLPVWARGLRTAQWRASDANGDPLRFRVDVRAEGGGPWIKLAEDLEQPACTWDTGALPDGRYRLRVTASDATDNPVGEEGTDQALSAAFTVDNTAPAVTALDARAEGTAVVVTARAEDATSTLARFEVSLDDGAWRAVTPEGGLADGRALSARARLEDVAAGEHTVSVRAVDGAGNTATRAARVTVARAR